MRRLLRNGATALASLWAVSGAIAPASGQVRGLVEMQRYGWDDPAPAGTTTAQRRLGGGMLSEVADLAEGANGALYVLDRGESKVVVFASDGSVRRIVGQGNGQGPGEFTRPTSIALTSTGDLLVLDANRVHVFDSTGTYRRVFTIDAPIPHQLRIVRDRIVVSQYLLRAGIPSLQIYSMEGVGQTPIFAPTTEDLEFSRVGASYRLVSTREGVVVAHPNPGRWASAETGRTMGRLLDAENTITRPAPSLPASSRTSLRGFGVLGNGNGLLLFDRTVRPATTPLGEPIKDLVLAEMTPKGDVVKRVRMPDVGGQLLVSRDGASFYLTIAEPTYQVVRFRFGAR